MAPKLCGMKALPRAPIGASIELRRFCSPLEIASRARWGVGIDVFSCVDVRRSLY